MQDKVNVTDYNSRSFRWATVGLVLTLPIHNCKCQTNVRENFVCQA